MHRQSVFRGLLLPALAAIALPLLAAIALPVVLPSQEGRGVILRAAAPADAREVVVSGSMNGWTGQRMGDPDRDGVYEIAFDLAPGTYEYRLVADGRPLTDHASRPDGISILVVRGGGSPAE